MEAVRTKYHQLHPLMTERLRRQWAACEAESLGRSGPSIVAEATGLSRTTIWSGRRNSRRRANQPRDDLAARTSSGPGRRTPSRGAKGFGDPHRLAGFGRLIDEGGSAITSVLDLQECTEGCRGTERAGSCGEPSDGRSLARRLGVQPASQSEDQGRPRPRRSRCPVPIHQSTGRPFRRTTNRPSQSTPRRRKT